MTMQTSLKGRRWRPKARKTILDSDDEEQQHSRASSMSPYTTPISPLTSLPAELLQHVFLHLLKPCLWDFNRGERNLRDAVLGLAATSRITRSNIIAVLRMLRKEIASGGMLVGHCARPWEMRVLVLTLDYNLTTGSRVPVRIERYRDVLRGGEKPEVKKRYKLVFRGGSMAYESEDD